MACYLGNKRLSVRVLKPQYRVRTICRSDRSQCKPTARAEDPRIQACCTAEDFEEASSLKTLVQRASAARTSRCSFPDARCARVCRASSIEARHLAKTQDLALGKPGATA